MKITLLSFVHLTWKHLMLAEQAAFRSPHALPTERTRSPTVRSIK